MKRVLIVDDEQRMRRVLQILVEKIGLESYTAESGEAALKICSEEKIDLVLSDVKMAPMDGLEFLRRLRSLDADVPVVILTAFGSISTAVEAMKLGAFDFVLKPFDREALEIIIRKALDVSRYQLENRFYREQSDSSGALADLIGDSPSMQPVFDLVRKIAPTKSTVLVTGETGTGKELVARAIHKLSPRAEKLFVPLNCTAIPADLLESELFGHVRGAFTGAHAERIGKFQAADEGTLFLDEIGDLHYPLQAKLLRFLQEGVVEPVGANRRVSVDVRIVSSTNRDLPQAIREGKFREDLFYRLNVFEVRLPPLRERREDIPALANAFLAKFSKELGKPVPRLSSETAQSLGNYAWPGNVRELRNLMERTAVLSPPGEVPSSLVRSLLPEQATLSPVVDLNLDRAIAEVERKLILHALAEADGNKIAAAGLLGIAERTLWTKLKRYAL
jgi:two-component system, NtrC family, response regulator AtoC